MLSEAPSIFLPYRIQQGTALYFTQYDANRSVNVCSSHSNCELNHFWLLQFPSQNNEAIVHKHYSQSLEQKAEENVLLIPLNSQEDYFSEIPSLFVLELFCPEGCQVSDQLYNLRVSYLKGFVSECFLNMSLGHWETSLSGGQLQHVFTGSWRSPVETSRFCLGFCHGVAALFAGLWTQRLLCCRLRANPGMQRVSVD